jgi:proteasome accessory factor A
MIEANFTKGLPIIQNPVDSLHRLAADWNLVTRVPTNRGEMSALEIQKLYLSTARAYVDSVPANLRGEAKLVLYRWQELYEGAARFRKNAADIDLAMGRIDWLTKRHMIDALSDGDGSASGPPSLGTPELGTSTADFWAARKKIDLRYHELSDEGYYLQLLDGRPELRLVNDEQIARRRKSPPAGSPAARRGWLIREFAGGEETMQSEWAYAMIGNGRKKRRVDFVEEA